MATPVLVDSNVLLDISTEDPTWFEWSADALAKEADEAPLLINPLIYAEVSLSYETIEDLESAIPRDLYRRQPLTLRGRFPRREGVSPVQETRRRPPLSAAGLLHRRARGCRSAAPLDSRCQPLPDLFPLRHRHRAESLTRAVRGRLEVVDAHRLGRTGLRLGAFSSSPTKRLALSATLSAGRRCPMPEKRPEGVPLAMLAQPGLIGVDLARSLSAGGAPARVELAGPRVEITRRGLPLDP